MKSVRKSSPVDCYVGSRLRMLRKDYHLSQAKLAHMMNLSHQQIQQYELGVSRISAGTLYEITTILDVPITYFYEGIQSDDYADMSGNALSFERAKPLDILLIESNAADEVKFRQALVKCEQDSTIYVERTGVDALEFLRGKRKSGVFLRPEIIILDLNISKRDGHEVLKEVKKDRNLASIPIVVVATSADYNEVSQLYADHASGFIRKSLDETKFDEDVAVIVQYWSRIILPSMRCN